MTKNLELGQFGGKVTIDDTTQSISLGSTLQGPVELSGDLNVSGVVTATTFYGDFTGAITGNSDTATALETPRTIALTGDVVATATSFDGTSNISIAATIQPNSVGLGTDTFGDYIESISGTANEITVTGGTGERSTPQIGLSNNVTIGDALTVTNDALIGGNLTVTGNLTIDGTQTILNTEVVDVEDATVGIASTSTASNTTADGAGIVVYGGSDGDKTLLWNTSKNSFEFNQNITGLGATFSEPIRITAPSGDRNLISFDTDRSWAFNTKGAGGLTFLELKSNVSGKYFNITNHVEGVAASFFAGLTTSLNRVHLVSGGGKVGVGTSSVTSEFDILGKTLIGDLIDSANISNVVNIAASAGINAYRPINLVDSTGKIKVARGHDIYGPGIDMQSWDESLTTLRGRWIPTVEEYGFLLNAEYNGVTTQANAFITPTGNLLVGNTGTSVGSALSTLVDSYGRENKLQVIGRGYFSDAVGIGTTNTTTDIEDVNLYVNGVTVLNEGEMRLIYSDPWSYTQFGTSSTDTDARWRVTRYSSINTPLAQSEIYSDSFYVSGDVGIGSFIPRTKLDVYTTASSGTATSEVARFSCNVAGGTRSITISAPGDTNAYGKFALENTDFPMQFWTGFTSARVVELTSNGRVAIGTDQTPVEIVDVDGDVFISNRDEGEDTRLRLYGSGTTNDPIFEMGSSVATISDEGFQIWYDNNVGDVHLATTYNNDAGAIRFHTKASDKVATGTNERLTIYGNGNVGIASILPTNLLDVNGDVSIASTVSIGTSIQIVPYNDLGTLSFEGSAGQLLGITNNLTSGSIFSVNDVSGVPSIDVDAEGNVFISPYTGSVKIGAASTSSNLDNVMLSVQSSDVGSEAIRIGNGGDSVSVQGKSFIGLAHYSAYSNQYPSAKIGVIENGAATYGGDMLFCTRDNSGDTDPLERMRLTKDGYLGINTDTSIRSFLHVSGNYDTSRITIESVDNGRTSFDGSEGGLDLVCDGMNGTNRFTPSIKFGSTDPQFTTTNPKFGAGIVGEATQTYSSDTTGGMGLSFWTTPDDPGTGQAMQRRVYITQAGAVGINTSDIEDEIKFKTFTEYGNGSSGTLYAHYNDVLVTDTNLNPYGNVTRMTLKGSNAAAADRSAFGNYIDINSFVTGGDTNDEHRIYGNTTDLDVYGDSNFVLGNYTIITQRDTTSNVWGNYTLVRPYDTSGNMTNVLGNYTIVQPSSSASGAISNLTGVKSRVNIDSTSTSDVTNAHCFHADIDNDAGSSATLNFVTGLYVDYTVTTGMNHPYGVYVQDTVPRNYFGGKVGIGITNSDYLLDVNGGRINIDSGYGDLQLGPSNTSFCHITTDRSKFYFDSTIIVDDRIYSYNADLVLGTNNGTVEGIRIQDTTGYALLGYTSSNGAYRLQVNSQIFATSSTIATSDGRYKENVETLTGGLELVKQLNPVSFTWIQGENIEKTKQVTKEVLNDKAEEVLDENGEVLTETVEEKEILKEAHNFPEGYNVGFIAQEVQQSFSDKPWIQNLIRTNHRDAVYDEDGNLLAEEEEFLGIAEGNMIPILTSALKECISKIETLEQQVQSLMSN